MFYKGLYTRAGPNTISCASGPALLYSSLFVCLFYLGLYILFTYFYWFMYLVLNTFKYKPVYLFVLYNICYNFMLLSYLSTYLVYITFIFINISPFSFFFSNYILYWPIYFVIIYFIQVCKCLLAFVCLCFI